MFLDDAQEHGEETLALKPERHHRRAHRTTGTKTNIDALPRAWRHVLDAPPPVNAAVHERLAVQGGSAGLTGEPEPAYQERDNRN